MASTHVVSKVCSKGFYGLGTTLLGLVLTTATAVAEVGEPEKEDLKFGFIKLTDMAPLAIAYEMTGDSDKARAAVR